MGQINPAAGQSLIGYFDRAELHAEFAHCFRDLGNGEWPTTTRPC